MTRKMLIAAPALVAAALSIAGCSSLPSDGPLASQVEDDAGLNASYDSKGYVLVDVTTKVVAALANEPLRPLIPADFGTPAPGAGATMGIGDGVTVAIWEAGAGGLFTTAAIGGFQAGARNVIVPEQVVGTDGTISIPYAGRIRVTGLDPHQVEDAIQKRLTGKAIEPQVTVALTHPLSNTVSLMGEIGASGRIPVGPRGLRLLEAIATAGGIHVPSNQAVVRLSRNGRTASVPFLVLLDHPEFNVEVIAGDVVTVVQQPKTITTFGATGRNAIVPFETVTLSLEEAIAKAGGIADERADPKGVYVFRYEPASLVARMAPGQMPGGGAQAGADPLIPVVYRLDLGSVASYFEARDFQMRDKDMIYVANARLSQVQKFLALVNAIISPAVTGITIQNAAK